MSLSDSDNIKQNNADIHRQIPVILIINSVLSPRPSERFLKMVLGTLGANGLRTSFWHSKELKSATVTGNLLPSDEERISSEVVNDPDSDIAFVRMSSQDAKKYAGGLRNINVLILDPSVNVGQDSITFLTKCSENIVRYTSDGMTFAAVENAINQLIAARPGIANLDFEQPAQVQDAFNVSTKSENGDGLDSDLARNIAIEGAQRAASLVKENGRYIYCTLNGELQPGYNLLRHCGTAWSVLDIARTTGNQDINTDAAKRSMDWVLERKLFPLNDGLCISSGTSTKLGGAGLGILAFTELAKRYQDLRYLSAANGLARFILACKLEDGDFLHKINIKTGSLYDFRSEYYTGEALFGLIRLYQHNGNRDLLEAANDSITRLSERDYGLYEQSHWMMYALSALHSITEDPKLIDYAGRICRNIIDFPAYRDRKKSAPISCRAEAMGAYTDMLVRAKNTKSSPNLNEVEKAFTYDILSLMEFRTADGSFIDTADRPRIQIDYIQHASSAFLGYWRNYESLMEERKAVSSDQ